MYKVLIFLLLLVSSCSSQRIGWKMVRVRVIEVVREDSFSTVYMRHASNDSTLTMRADKKYRVTRGYHKLYYDMNGCDSTGWTKAFIR